MSGNKQLFKSILISGLAVVISYLINYFLTSYITSNVGIDAYGFVSIAKTAVSYAQIITIALTNFTVRFIAVSFHENKIKEAQGYYTSSIVASVVMSVSIFVIALFAIWKLEYLLNIPESLTNSVKLLFVIVFINFILSTVLTPFSAAAVIKNRLDIVGIIKIISYCCDAGTLIIMFMNFTPAVWFVGVGSLAATTVNLLGNMALTRTLTPDLKFNRALASVQKIKTILSNGIYNSINSLGNVLNSGLDLIVSNLLLSGVATGQIAVVKTLATIFSTLTATVYQPMQPKLIESYSSGNMDWFISELKKAMRLCGLFVSIAFAGFCALGELYYDLWLPDQDTALLYSLTVLTVFMYVMDGMLQPVYYVNTLTLKNRIPCFLTIFSGLLNVAAMYLLLKYTGLGVYAVVGTTTVIMFCMNMFFNPLYASWALKISPKHIYNVIFKHLLETLIMVILFRLVAIAIHPAGWLGLIASACFMCVIGILVHLGVMYSSDERKKLTEKIKIKNIRK